MGEIEKAFINFIAINREKIEEITFRFLMNNSFKIEREEFDYFTKEKNLLLRLPKNSEILESELFIPTTYDDDLYKVREDFDILFMEYLKSKVVLTYQEQLQHSLWKEKSKYIKEQRNNKCEKCGSDKFLQTHHKYYEDKKLAWEYPDEAFECLCGRCHALEHGIDLDEVRKKWVEDNSVSMDNVVLISKTRMEICRMLKDTIVNNVVGTFEFVELNRDSMYFKSKNAKINNYLKKNFPNIIYINNGKIKFSLKGCRNYSKNLHNKK